MVSASQAPGRQQHHQEQRSHGEADHDRRQHQGLGQRVGVVEQVLRHAVLDDRLLADKQAAHAEDEQVDPVGQQAQAHHHLERPWPQDQPDARGRQDPNGNCDDFFHQAAPPGLATAFAWLPGLWARTDWWPRAVSISKVAPTTMAYTPTSKNNALATWMSPSTGRLKCQVWVVRNG